MTRVGTYPVHVACLRCSPPEVFFSLYHLWGHYSKRHPISIDRAVCACGHLGAEHHPTKRWCLEADEHGECVCARFQEAA